ncbi:MAG: hypothetical protein D6815_02370 [Candidatus Dadabacteria bacterium]|nr:MAG: hypothetical protein D6815_02370 [Candidatus Dadabacteria bacterium]
MFAGLLPSPYTQARSGSRLHDVEGTEVERVEKKIQDVFSQITQTVGAERIGQALSGALVGAARTKATLERNLDMLMGLANLPTRSDYQRLQTKLDSLQGSIVNLTRAVEELKAAVADGRTAKARTTRSPAGKKAGQSQGSRSKSGEKNSRRR